MVTLRCLKGSHKGKTLFFGIPRCFSTGPRPYLFFFALEERRVQAQVEEPQLPRAHKLGPMARLVFFGAWQSLTSNGIGGVAPGILPFFPIDTWIE